MPSPKIFGYDPLNWTSLLGRTIRAIHAPGDNNVMTFEFDDGSWILMGHRQDCCEHVEIEDVAGDLSDLVGVPLLRAEERTSSWGGRLDGCVEW